MFISVRAQGLSPLTPDRKDTAIMTQRALIVGLGIAGMASAMSLKKAGWEPVIVERAPERRTGGYFIGLQDAGKHAAERLGVLPGIHIRTPEASPNWHMTKDGRRVRVAGFADQPTRPATLLRGDIEEGLWNGVDGQVEIRFGTSPVAIVERADGVDVTLDTKDGSSTIERFDLVIGADGLRFTVRKLVFGPQEKFMHSLDVVICAYQLEEQMETFRQRDGVILNQDKRSLWVFPLQDHTPTAFFAYRTKDVDAQFERPAVETLRDVFADMEPHSIVEEALEDLSNAPDYLFDSVHTVEMDRWHKGRVVLVGDSAWCLTLFSGMGATAGLMGGQQLGEALAAQNGNVPAALKSWEGACAPTLKNSARPCGSNRRCSCHRTGFSSSCADWSCASAGVISRSFQQCISRR